MFPLSAAPVVPSLPHDVVPLAESFTLPQTHAPIDSSWLTEELKYFETCLLVLDVLESFGTHISKDPSPSGRWAGKPKFLGHVFHWVRKNEPVQLTMPAFPCKSANRDNKVLGHLPDLGEELGMSRLNDIAVAIKNVYPPGALVNVASDGILFNDIIGVTDEETWDYGEELRAIAKAKKLDYIVFLYPQVLIGMMTDSEMTREKYIATADECRSLLEARHGSTIKEIEALIKADSDTNSTYCGMVKFLQTELFGALAGKSYKERQKLQKNSAKKMMQRSEAFTGAIRVHRSLDVRLSMHPSSGMAKLSIALIPSPKGFFQRSPWHSCVAIDNEGGYHCVHSEEVRETHELMYKDNRPYFFIAKDAVKVDKPESVAVEEKPQEAAAIEKSKNVPALDNSTAAVAEKQDMLAVVEQPAIVAVTEKQDTAEQPVAAPAEKSEDTATPAEDKTVSPPTQTPEIAVVAEQPTATTPEKREIVSFIDHPIPLVAEQRDVVPRPEQPAVSFTATATSESKHDAVATEVQIATADSKLSSTSLEVMSFTATTVSA